jgi:2-C-methyl-D-erythritol 4-phosphate cytidylyltransferase
MKLKSSTKWVAIHDAARPLVDSSDVSRVVRAAQRDGAAILGVQSVDTIKQVAGESVLATQPRSESFLAQTPQVFRREILLEACEKAKRDNFLGTDDAHLVERLGVPVTVVTAKTSNRKITYKEDLVWAEAVLKWRQNGGRL